jgi:TRAP transporter TAXI family solute receptor
VKSLTKPLLKSSPRYSRRMWRWLIGFAVVLVVLLALLFLVVRQLSPLPPRSLVMSTGAEDGAYHLAGLRYQRLLAADGVQLELRASAGSIENIDRLQNNEVSVAFVQGGTGPQSSDAAPEETPLRALANVAFEPVWIFTHTLDLTHGLRALAGKRIAAGQPGSGNLQLTIELLKAYGIDVGSGAGARTAPDGTVLTADSGLQAAEKLQRHEVDAVFVVAGPKAAAVQRLLSDPAIKLASLDHVEGLSRRFGYLQPVSLKRGSVDPARDLPHHDIALLATNTNLVVREDLHPALAYLLLDAAQQVHRSAGLLQQPGEFPNPRVTDFALSDTAERYFRSGPPFLRNYLPFWVANYVQRLVLVLVPFLAIAIPLVRLLPPFITWRRQSQLFRRYAELKFLERQFASRTLTEEDLRAASEQLDRIEKAIADTRFSWELSDRVYTLRQHVDYVRDRISRDRGA